MLIVPVKVKFLHVNLPIGQLKLHILKEYRFRFSYIHFVCVSSLEQYQPGERAQNSGQYYAKTEVIRAL